jgi:hypothetical protein
MTRRTAHNIKAVIINLLMVGVGYCFGGQTGVGIALLIILAAQLI